VFVVEDHLLLTISPPASVYCRPAAREGDDVAKFAPLEHQKAPTAVVAQIRQAILSGALRAGEQLREAHIAEEMGISRSPIREALSRLEEEGLVIKVPFKGAFVASVSPDTIAEIAGIRTQLEPYAVSLALPRLSSTDWKNLRSILEEMHRVAGNDLVTAIEKHLAFHRYFYERSGNRTLLDMWSDWESKLRLFFIFDHGAFQDSNDVVAVHEELIDIFRTGGPEEIRSAFAHHVHDAPGTEAGDPLQAARGENSATTA
jgi:DNA-binding GntR family transcriptional regulator